MRCNLIFVFVCIVWGSSFILMKTAAETFGPISIGNYRVLLGGACLAAIWACRRVPAAIPRRKWPALLLVASLGYILPFVLQPWIIHRLNNSGLIGMVVAFVPLTTGLVSIPMLGVRPTRREMLGILGGLAALIVYNLDGVLREIPAVYLLLACLIPFCYSVSNTAVKRWFNDIDALPMTCCSLLLAGLFCTPIAVATEPIVLEGARFWDGFGWLFILGVLCTGVANYSFYYLIQHWGPLQAGMVTYVIPLVALGWAALMGEEITALQVAALAIAFSMVWLVRGGKRHRIPPDLEPA